MSQPPEDRKIDLSNIPRGAIGPRGMPVSRNARLPSIRTPRDLTLGTQSKRTFLPNIPVRREKRAAEPKNDGGNTSSEINSRKNSKMFSPKISERGRGRGRGRGQIIQTEGSVFGEGIAVSTSSRGRQRESSSSQRSSFPSGKASAIKREKVEISSTDITRDMDNLMRDDFIDDGDYDDKLDAKPIMFPPSEIKRDHNVKIKAEDAGTTENFNNQDFAKEMGFDVKKIAKFIKKEKGDEDHVKQTTLDSADLPKNQISELLRSSDSQLLLLRFPECIASHLPDYQQKGHASVDPSPPNDQKNSSGNLASLPEGHIGRLQILKSGHTRLVIGALQFDLDSVTSLKSKHDVASVHHNTNSGDIVLLGSVLEKLSFAPDIQNVLS